MGSHCQLSSLVRVVSWIWVTAWACASVMTRPLPGPSKFRYLVSVASSKAPATRSLGGLWLDDGVAETTETLDTTLLTDTEPRAASGNCSAPLVADSVTVRRPESASARLPAARIRSVGLLPAAWNCCGSTRLGAALLGAGAKV